MQRLTVDALSLAMVRALTVQHPVEVVDDTCHVIAQVDQRGHVVIRREEQRCPDALYRTAGS